MLLAQRQYFGTDGIHFVRPGENATLQVPYLAEAGLAQELDGFRRALAAAAVRHDFARAVEFADAPRKLAERNQMAAEIADLIFVRLAHVENVEIVAAIEPRFQLARSDFGNVRCGAGASSPRIPQNSA